MKQIIIDIRKNGTTKIEAKGYKGNNCQKATQPFEELLGEVQDRELKDSFYEIETENLNSFSNENNELKQY